jgi:hypothetical protein
VRALRVAHRVYFEASGYSNVLESVLAVPEEGFGRGEGSTNEGEGGEVMPELTMATIRALMIDIEARLEPWRAFGREHRVRLQVCDYVPDGMIYSIDAHADYLYLEGTKPARVVVLNDEG